MGWVVIGKTGRRKSARPAWAPYVSRRHVEMTVPPRLEYPFDLFAAEGRYWSTWMLPPRIGILRSVYPGDVPWIDYDPPTWHWTKPRIYNHEKDGI